jgi:hypothetical protein
MQLEHERSLRLFSETSDKIAKLNLQKNNGKLSEKDMDLYIKLLDKRLDLVDKINKSKEGIDLTSYYINTSDILFKYYDLVEKGQKQDEEIVTNNSDSILRYFSSRPIVTEETCNKDACDRSRGLLFGDYMSIIDKDYIKPIKKSGDDKCTHCGSTNIIPMVNDGYSYCSCCHSMENMIVDHNKPSYKDPPKEITYFSYKRINHLNEWLNQIQGKETTEIPEEIYDKILCEIKKQRVTNMADLTYGKIKKILKQLKGNKYYEHVPHIINRLNGVPMPNFSPELEEKLRCMFKQIQAPFLKHSPQKRKNFLSYSYVLKKFLQLLEKDEFLEFFQLLKSRDKLAAQDKIWKKICDDIGWQFIPSL